MRILIVHNAYRLRGGEDSVMEAEAALLTSRGQTVEMFLRHNDAIEGMSRIGAALNTTWSASVARDFDLALRSFRPDVVHVHNTFPLISPAIYWVAYRLRVPVVQTLHNFRLLCPGALFLREGKVCEDCIGRLPWRGVVRACYRGSRPASAALAGMLAVHRAAGTWRNKVSRYIALNEFCRAKFVAGGLPAERIVVKPNFVDFPVSADGERAGLLFVGRLSAEKGVTTLAEAARRVPDVALRVAGSGPEASCLDGIAGVAALGALDGDSVRAEMNRALALVLPSIWYENFPRTLVEAYACGLPVIASRLGALAELVEDGETGLLFEPGNARELAERMTWAQAHPQQMAEMGRKARALYEAEFTADRNYAQLMGIYRDAIDENNKSRLAA